MLHCEKTPERRPPRRMKDRPMSRQLTLSSLFAVLAMAGLCVATSARDLAGIEAPMAHTVQASGQAELSPGLPA
jgi:hypothetical protein